MKKFLLILLFLFVLLLVRESLLKIVSLLPLEAIGLQVEGVRDFLTFIVVILLICFWIRPESFTAPLRSFWRKIREKRNFAKNPPPSELVDFKEEIGFHVDPVTREKKITSWGIIHYSRNGGYHVIPAIPEHAPNRIVDHIYLRLSTQRALLGAVTPNLRAVEVSISEEDRVIFIYFFYDGRIKNRIFDCATTAIAEVSADIFPDYVIAHRILRMDTPSPIPRVLDGDRVYSRHQKYKTKRVKIGV